MNVVDSSGWLAYFAGDANADFFSAPIQDVASLIVPTISLNEVFKRILQQRDETSALQAIGFMSQGRTVDLTPSLALHAARISDGVKIPMADSLMLATAREYEATLWTQDADLEGLAGVRYIEAGNTASSFTQPKID